MKCLSQEKFQEKIKVDNNSEAEFEITVKIIFILLKYSF